MKDHQEKLSDDEKKGIEEAIKGLEEAIKSDNKDEIEAKNKVLAEASQKLGEKVYAEEQAKQQAGQQSEAASDNPKEKTVDAEVVDADFEEVKKEDKTEAKSDK